MRKRQRVRCSDYLKVHVYELKDCICSDKEHEMVFFFIKKDHENASLL